MYAIGIPSVISAKGNKYIRQWNSKNVLNPYGLSTHDVYWTEMSANKSAAKYFKTYYGVDWEKSVSPKGYPTKNPFK